MLRGFILLLVLIHEPLAVFGEVQPRGNELNVPERVSFVYDSSEERCHAIAQDASDGDNILTAQEYVSFLHMLSYGQVSYFRFADLPFPLVTTFLAAACTNGKDCIDKEPSVAVAKDVQFLCRNVLKALVLETNVGLHYDIQYKGASHSLKGCLEEAALKVLRDTFGKCSKRALEKNHWECPKIDVNVTHVIDRGKRCTSHQPYLTLIPVCDPPVNEESIRCALVNSRTFVTVNQMEAMSSTALRDTVVEVLSSAIIEGRFERHIPRRCH